MSQQFMPVTSHEAPQERHRGGRPRIIETPEEFSRLVDEYVQQCRDSKSVVTFTGMALHLGFASRQSFYDYGKREGFSYSVSRARLLVEAEYERRLYGKSPQGAIFALKNYGWSDRLDVAAPDGIPLRFQSQTTRSWWSARRTWRTGWLR